MNSKGVVFKGTRNGIIIKIIGQNDFNIIREAIEYKLENTKDFFKDGKVYIDFSESELQKEHREDITALIKQKYNIVTNEVENSKSKVFNGIYEGRTKFITNTIRSGQNVEYVGNLVVVGDINAGAKVIAGGNIIALGTLRGVVHAGASGNDKAVIAAFSLQPTQLRIAGIISRPPDGEQEKPKLPELARIKDGIIVIEPYAPNKYL